MKNPFRSERGTLTSGRACAVYALAFVLMLFLDATRFSSFLDRAGIDFPPAAVVGQTVKGVAEATGLAAFSEAETRLVTAFNTDKTLGTVEGPSVAAAPSTAPQRPRSRCRWRIFPVRRLLPHSRSPGRRGSRFRPSRRRT